jgi:hypothetical protein
MMCCCSTARPHGLDAVHTVDADDLTPIGLRAAILLPLGAADPAVDGSLDRTPSFAPCAITTTGTAILGTFR